MEIYNAYILRFYRKDNNKRHKSVPAIKVKIADDSLYMTATVRHERSGDEDIRKQEE